MEHLRAEVGKLGSLLERDSGHLMWLQMWLQMWLLQMWLQMWRLEFVAGETLGTGCAFSQTRGSAVRMPSTSFHTCTSS